MMSLPELRTAVGRYIGRRDLVDSVRVCRDWNRSFSPFLYERVDLRHSRFGQDCPENAASFPSPAAILRNGSCVRDLRLSLPCALLDHITTTTRNLRSLTIDAELGNEYFEIGDWMIIEPLLANNSRIQQLEIGYITGVHVTHCLDLTARSCPSLRTVNLKDVYFDLSALWLLLGNCPRLHTVSINCPELTDAHNRFDQVPILSSISNLKNLELIVEQGSGIRGLNNLLKACASQLEILHLDAGLAEEFSETPLTLPPLVKFSRLVKLELDNMSLTRQDLEAYPLDDYTPIMLKEVMIADEEGIVDEADFRVLKRLFKKLTWLDLYETVNVQSPICMEILSTFLNLAHCGLPTLKADEIIAVSNNHSDGEITTSAPTATMRRPINTTLKSLELRRMDFSISHLKNNHETMSLLGSFQGLESLTIMAVNWGCGLGAQGEHWKGGRFLRKHLEQDAEVRWVLHTWPCLQVFDCAA
ncbi:hypothetical protein BGZ83_004464 [Gryganskiella cystojenkinii]|nr:hypothetical protein BGZ83_004464 [Gryganskiella cystojenkinii]